MTDVTQEIVERDNAEMAVAMMYRAVTGKEAEWSSEFRLSHAVVEVEATIASLRAELAEARRKGMMDAAGIAMTHFPGSADYEPYMAAGHAISKAIRRRATAAGADHDR